MPRLLPWLDERVPDVVCLQETKLPADAFDELVSPALAERGYAVAHHGDGRWNGVAILSRVGLDDVVAGLLDEPGFPDPQARAVSATCAGLRVISVYVPNGRTPDDPHYQYKLEWLAALRATVAAGDPAVTVVCGDMNVAPTDDDVYSAAAFATSTHVTPRNATPWAPSGCATWCGNAGPPSGSSPTGTTAPACSTRTAGCGSI